MARGHGAASTAAAAAATDGTPPTPAPTDNRRWLWVHLASLALAVPVLVWINRDQWFSGDEWQVITTNGLGSNPTRSGLFAPHFEHWITLGILVYKALYGVFAARTYAPYVAVMIAVILAVAHLSWRLFLRIGVSPAWATAVAALTTVMAVGWENRSTAFQMVVIGPVALGFGALLLMPATGPLTRRDAAVVALLLLGLMCSGTGVTMTVVVVLAALLRRGWKVAAGIAVVPAVVYGIWYVSEGSSGQHDDTALSTALRDLPEFVWRGLTSAFSDLTRIPYSGGFVLVVVVAWLIWSVWRDGPRTEPWPLVIATTLGAVASIALTGLRRAGASPESRYSDIVVLLALPALALLTQQAGRWVIQRLGRPALAVCSAVVVVFLVVQVVALNHDVSNEPFVGEMRPRVLATARILRDHEPLTTTNIFGIYFLTEPSTSTIARLDRNGELPALHVSRADILTAREYVGVVVGDASRYPEGVVRTVTISGGSSGAASPGCLSVAPATPGTAPVVVLELPAAGSFRVTTDPAADVPMSFVQGDARGRPRVITATPGDGIGVGVPRATNIELTLPRTTTTLCGLGRGGGSEPLIPRWQTAPVTTTGDELLDDDQVLIADAIRELCTGFDDDYWAKRDHEHEFPWDFYARMAEGGWLGLAIPEEYGGGGRGITDAAVMLHEIARSGAAMNGCSAVHLTVFGLNPVVKFGTDRLKETFLPRAAAGDLHVAFGVTEPDAGTDTGRISTRAEPDGNGGWRIHGRKIWTSKALESEVVLLIARTGDKDSGLKGLSLFLADLDRDYVDIRPIPKVGRNAVASCEVAYDGLPVESWRLLGEEGNGFKLLLHGLNPERVLLASEACGIGEVALDRALTYAKERIVFDRPIGANQAISHPLAHAHAQLRAAWMMALHAGRRYDAGLDCGEAANTAKYLAAEASFYAADRAVQTLGGMGYASEYHVERYWREARLQKIAPVTQEMTLNYLAQNILGLPRSY